MKTTLLSSFAVLTAVASFGQNSVTINQSGGAGNTASVTQSGDGNSVSISQTGGAISSDSKPGNRVSLRVPTGTETTISQHHTGPNSVEISQEGQATAVIDQFSETSENSINALPNNAPNPLKSRASKRRNKRQ